MLNRSRAIPKKELASNSVSMKAARSVGAESPVSSANSHAATRMATDSKRRARRVRTKPDSSNQTTETAIPK